MDLDGGLRQVEFAADLLVGQALQQQPEHVGLPRGEPQGRNGDRGLGPGRGGAGGRLLQRLGRHVDAPRGHEPNGRYQHLVQRRLGQEPTCALLQRMEDDAGVVVCGEHDHRQLRQPLRELFEQAQAADIGQLDVHQHEVDVGMLLQLLPQRRGVPRLHALGEQLGAAEDGLQALPDKAMVVNDEDLHEARYYRHSAPVNPWAGWRRPRRATAAPAPGAALPA